MKTLLLIFTFPLLFFSHASGESSGLTLPGNWDASWITHPEVNDSTYGIYYFRKEFELSEIPEEFIVHVSADDRYTLYVNGTEICYGPALSDFKRWKYETINVHKYLHKGTNTIAAKVINWGKGEFQPQFQLSLTTGFLLQGNAETESIINSDETWKVVKDEAIQPISVKGILPSFIVVPPTDEVHFNKLPRGWTKTGFDDSAWKNAAVVTGAKSSFSGSDEYWQLSERNIPLMENSRIYLQQIRRADNIEVNESFLSGNTPLVVPPNTKATVIFDQTHLTNAFTFVNFSKGADSKVGIKYSEAAWERKGPSWIVKFDDRNRTEGGSIEGFQDVFFPDGSENQTYKTTWWRNYRYIELTVETQENPLIINEMYGIFVGYPYKMKASYDFGDSSLIPLGDVAWRTVRLNSFETFMDGPYWEATQYIGDTRVMSLVALYLSGDDRLSRKAIEDFSYGQVENGLLTSQYPANLRQTIPTFSLIYIYMLHDYWMNRQDDKFISQFLPIADDILAWYSRYIDEEAHMLGTIGTNEWNWVDWAFLDYKRPGVPFGANNREDRGGIDNHSAIVTLMFVKSLQDAAKMNAYFGNEAKSEKYFRLAENLKKGTYDNCWDEEKGLLADVPEKLNYSEHAQIFGILTDAIPLEKQAALLEKTIHDESLTRASIYYKFYLHRAIKKAGYGDHFRNMLTLWEELINRGFTTYPERSFKIRSDCHGWGAFPLYDFYTIIAGIEPDSPGFETVKINPNPGNFPYIKVSLPHPKGTIEVNLKNENDDLNGEIILPAGLTGTYMYKDERINLKEGLNPVGVK